MGCRHHGPGGYRELTYFGEKGGDAYFGFAVGTPPCEDKPAACVNDRIDTLSGGDRDAYTVDTITRENLPKGNITLMSRRSSASDNGWTAVAFVTDGKDLYEFLIGDTNDLASVFAAIDSARPA